MAITIEMIHKEMKKIQNDLHLLKNIVAEDYELSERTMQKLNSARKTPRSQYISHEVIKERFLK